MVMSAILAGNDARRHLQLSLLQNTRLIFLSLLCLSKKDVLPVQSNAYSRERCCAKVYSPLMYCVSRIHRVQNLLPKEFLAATNADIS